MEGVPRGRGGCGDAAPGHSLLTAQLGLEELKRIPKGVRKNKEPGRVRVSLEKVSKGGPLYQMLCILQSSANQNPEAPASGQEDQQSQWMVR